MPRKPLKPAKQEESVDEFFDPDTVFTPAPQAPNVKAIANIYKGMQSVQGGPANVLKRVRAVPTRFPSFDWATRVGGMPTERFCVVHGPSSHGKTSFVHGVGESFLRANHFYHFIDAERTTPIEWLEGLMGDACNSPMFIASRPKSFEQTVLDTRIFLNNIIKAKKAGDLPPETSALIAVDSIRKLVPENILAKMVEAAKKEELKGGVDGYSGRAGQIKAALNAAWLDELIPLLDESGACMIAITRESQNTLTDMFSVDWKMTGGNALEFDSSLIVRVERDAWLKVGEGENATITGERHRLTIRKTKVGGKEGKNTRAYFHTSNGTNSPEGFNRALDVFMMAQKFGIIASSGGWFAYEPSDGSKGFKWHGEQQALRVLNEKPELLQQIEATVRKQFQQREPEKGDE